MGHRTLVAYDRDGYDLHYAHWGVDPDEITAATPYGGPPDGAWVRESAADRVEPAGGHVTEDHETAVDPEPLATGLSFGEVGARIDPVEHEALHVVDPAFSVRRYLAVALRTGPRRRRTALVGYDGPADARYLRGWIAGARAVRDASGAQAVRDASGAQAVRDASGDGGVDAHGGPGTEPVLAALRWLDPARGTVVFPAGDPTD